MGSTETGRAIAVLEAQDGLEGPPKGRGGQNMPPAQAVEERAVQSAEGS